MAWSVAPPAYLSSYLEHEMSSTAHGSKSTKVEIAVEEAFSSSFGAVLDVPNVSSKSTSGEGQGLKGTSVRTASWKSFREYRLRTARRVAVVGNERRVCIASAPDEGKHSVVVKLIR